MGVGIFVLPFFGLQFKIVSFMSELFQFAVGLILLAVGSALVIRSGANVVFGVVGFAATGFGGLIFLGAILLHSQGGVPGQEQQVANAGQPGAGMFPKVKKKSARRNPGPAPGQEPVPGFPTLNDQQGGPTPGMPGDNVRAVLSNASVTRSVHFGGRQLSLSVDYRFENGARVFGRPCVLMLESPGSNVKVMIPHLEAQGTITAEITPFGPNVPNSFEAYLAFETPGPGGMQPQAISDKISIAVPATQAAGANPPPGMPPGMMPGRMPPGAMPGGMPPGQPQFPRMPRPGFGGRRR
jgi:hypothetical protein